jgi:proton glutamate symport protein
VRHAVLIGLGLGAVAGLVVAAIDPSAAASAAGMVEPVGKLWLNALQMTVVPLVFALVVIGVTAASDAAASGRTARRAIVVMIVLLSAGVLLTITLTPFLLSLVPRDPAVVAALQGGSTVATTVPRIQDFVLGFIPSNAIAAAAQNAMLPLVVFALFFGFALTRIEPARRERLVEFFQAIADTMIVIVRWVLWAAPFGVFALVFVVCVSAGFSVLSALGIYILLQCSTYLLVTIALYGVAMVYGRERLVRFASAILPAQIVAASTQSSLASLPAMVESAQTRLGYPQSTVALVLPMAVSLFRITSPVQYMNAAIFVAWAYGVDLSAAQLLGGAALAVIISLSSVGLPGQVSFMATIMPVTQAMGLPVQPLGLLLAVDTIPDVFATVGNVTADLTATSIVTRQSRNDIRPSPPPTRDS